MSYLMNTYNYLPVTFVKGVGSKLYDEDGKEYIDLFSGIAVNSLGYNDEDWKSAVINQLNNLQHCSNVFCHPNLIKLSEKICTTANLSKIFFCNSGAEANEGAIKLARKYSFDKYGKGRSTIISLKNSFHGRTMATLTATGQEKFHNYFFPFVEDFKYCIANDVSSLNEMIDDSVCAIMMEAIQGEGGIHPLTEGFVQEVSKICKENDILMIFDEVQCGIGRTGKFFGYNNYNVNPDIVTMAKGLGGGLPIGAFACSEKLKDTLKPGDHGTTFGGNPVCTAGALAVLDKICNDSFLESVSSKFNIVKSFFYDKNLPIIKEIRGMGLMIGIEINGNASDVQNKALKNGVVVGTAGSNVIRLLPPLNISDIDLIDGLNILFESLQ